MNPAAIGRDTRETTVIPMEGQMAWFVRYDGVDVPAVQDDTFDFTSEPTTAADGSIPTETLSLNFDKITVFPPPMAPDTGEVDLSDYYFQKVCDHSTGEDSGIIIDFTPGPDDGRLCDGSVRTDEGFDLLI
jgi:hypothetical protein